MGCLLIHEIFHLKEEKYLLFPLIGLISSQSCVFLGDNNTQGGRFSLSCSFPNLMDSGEWHSHENEGHFSCDLELDGYNMNKNGILMECGVKRVLE